MKFKIFIAALTFTFLFTGCLPKQDDVKGVLQSDAAKTIRQDYKSIKKLLVKFQKKLNVRNPNSYDKRLSSKIEDVLKDDSKTVYLKYKKQILENYKDYLQIAFSKDDIAARNDYLILGIYYMLYDSYDMETVHKITALQYDKEKLQKLYKNLQIIKWKIKTQKNLKNQYLFLTWQNNWQIELAKKISKNEHITYNTLKSLKYIKNGKETLLDSSNFSFEVMLTQMSDRVENSLRLLGEEPKELAIETIGMFLFL